MMTTLTLESVFYSSPIGMALVSVEGVWIRVNPSLCSLLGYDEATLLQMKFQDITHPDDLGEDLEQVSRCLSGEIDRYQMNKRYLTRNKGTVHASLHVSLAHNELGDPKFFVRQVVDITPLVEKNQDLERFASAAAHQLRSPPRSILGMVDAILEDENCLSANSIEYLHDIRADALAMTEVVDGLSQFSKIRTMTEAETEWVDVSQVVREVQLRTLKLCPDRYSGCQGHTCKMEGSGSGCPVIRVEDLPKAHTNAFLLHQVFENLISNGLKFNNSKVKKIYVTGEVNHEGNTSVYHVEDNGIGIPQELQSKLFQMFERVHAGYPGSGVGLALADAIVRKLGGRLWVDKSDKSGTVFSFTLPREALRVEEVQGQGIHEGR